MTLLTTVFAAIICTIIWYSRETAREMKIGVLCWMYWGAALMWFIDAIFEYTELQSEYFTPALEDMINDIYLGFSAVALGLIIWLMVVLVRDPKGSVRAVLFKK